MAMRKTAMAMLMCAVFVIVFAAPLVRSESGDIHTIKKTLNGPPSTCALTWEMNPTVDGIWYAHIENFGMRWLIIDMVDQDTGAVVIDREMYRFAEWGDSFDTPSVEMTAGHEYWITGTPNGAMLTYVTVEDVFVGEVEPQPPVAAFTVTSVDGLTVSVDASASYDPDGNIMKYTWTWGDGSTSTGVTSSHTYDAPDGFSGPVVRDIPPPPYTVCGYTFGPDGVTKLPDCAVTITNLRTSAFTVISSGAAAFFNYDIAGIGYVVGDTIHVEAVKGVLVGENSFVVPAVGSYTLLNITLLEEAPPEPFEVTITLTVRDDDNMETSISQTLLLYP